MFVEDREKPNYIPTYNFIIIATPNTIKMDKRRRRSQLTIQQKQKNKKWLSTAISERHKSSRYVYDMEMSFR